MPRAFLVVKKKPQQQGAVMDLPASVQTLTQTLSSESLKRPRTDESVDSATTRYMAPLSGVVEQPRPSSASPAASYVSSEEPYSPATSEPREDRRSPPSDPPTLSCPTAGLPFAPLPSVYDLAPKRQRLSPEVIQDKVCTISPGSITSDTGSDASVVPSPCKPADQNPYRHMFHPRDSIPGQDMASQVDQVQPLSPLHHLVRQHHPLAFPSFPGYPMPFMRAPMFMPHHFRPHPLANIIPPTQQTEIHRDTEQEVKKEKSDKPSPRPKISHCIDDLLKKSPPKSKKPIDMTVEQPKPAIVQNIPLEARETQPQTQTMPQSPKDNFPGSTDLANSPMHQLVAMERLYAQSPRSIPHPLTQSPKTGSFAPVSNPQPSSPRSKPRVAPRSLEEDFKKQYLETILPEALRQRQQRLAEEYRELLKIQNSRVLEHQKQVEIKEEHAKERRTVPDIARNNTVYNNGQYNNGHYGQEYNRETVFPHRLGEGDKMLHPSIAERLSPSTLDNLPVDFSKACPKRPGPPRFQCDGCKKSYSTLNGLSKHKEFHCVSHVKKEFSCKQCSKTYTSLGALKMHIRTHTLPCKCQLCGKSFSRPWLLQGHIRTHTGEKPFSCQHCQRSFADRSNLRAHLQTHTDIKRYSCDSCTKTFSRMSLLTKHRENGCSSQQTNMMHH